MASELYKIQIKNQSGEWEELGSTSSEQYYLFYGQEAAEYYMRTHYPGPLAPYARIVPEDS